MKLIGLSKSYGAVEALKGISLDIPEGQITAVLGESGAGKTTLLNAIAGLIPYEGKIEGGGACSYLFQEESLLPNLTAEENLRFVLPKDAWGGIVPMLARVGLRGRERAYPRQLSGGERRRVAIARAFLYPHRLLLMDEPFSSLDLALKRTLIELVCEMWRQEGNTILFVTHDIHEAALLASRACVLRSGTLRAQLKITAPYPRDFFSRLPEEDSLMRLLMQPDNSDQ